MPRLCRSPGWWPATEAGGGRVRPTVADRGYIATAVGEGDRQVLSQVSFRGGDLADMKPGTVYVNDTDPDVRTLIGSSAEDFTAHVCKET